MENKNMILERKFEGVIYRTTESYNNLNEKEKYLIDEIIRYCENNKRFPSEKDMTKKGGYVGRTQYYKQFGGNTFANVYKYIIPIDNGTKGNNKKKLVESEVIKPHKVKCIKCGVEKEFTNEFFCTGKESKYGLKYECKDCNSKASSRRYYSEKGILYNNIEDISPCEWYEYYLENKINNMPNFCYSQANQIKIIRYVIESKMNLCSKSQIIKFFVRPNIEKYRIDMIIFRMGNKLSALQKCYPDYNFIEDDFDKYTDEYMFEVIERWIIENNITAEIILDGKTEIKKSKNAKDINALLAARYYRINKDMIDMFIWYFNIKGIKHPIYDREINRFDFRVQSKRYWNDKNNRINRIKYYCENQCSENILDIIDDTDKLKEWIYKYFKQEDISKHSLPYTPYNHSLYDVLIESYPNIKDNNILFNWEWHQWNNYNKELLLNMLREVVFYRLNDIIVNPIEDIPKYMNMNFMDAIYPKFSKHIDRKRFEDFYDWSCQSFPEYAQYWSRKDFGQIISTDEIKFDSYQEKDIYEYVRQKPLFKYIKPIGQNKSGSYTFVLDSSYHYERFCPDFIIEDVYIEGKKKKLFKPIIIEFYGMYVENHQHKIFQKYYKKTLAKEQFYKSRDDIYYIGIFPEDIKNNFKGLEEKLSSFFMQNFNIEINKVA